MNEYSTSWGYTRLCAILNEKYIRNDDSSIHFLATSIYASGVNLYGKMESIVILLSMIVDQSRRRDTVQVAVLPYPVSLVMVEDYVQKCYILVKSNKNYRKTDISSDISLSEMYKDLRNTIILENISGIFMPTWATARSYLTFYIEALTHYCVVVEKSNLFWITGEKVRMDYIFDSECLRQFLGRMNCYYNKRFSQWQMSNSSVNARKFFQSLNGCNDNVNDLQNDNRNTKNIDDNNSLHDDNWVDTEAEDDTSIDDCNDENDKTNVCVKSSLTKISTESKILPRTTSIGNDKDAVDHIELTDGVGQHLVEKLITQCKVNRDSVEMTEIKLLQTDSPKNVYGRVVCINILEGNSLFGISSSEIYTMAQSTSMVHRKDVFCQTDAKHGFVGFSCQHKSSVFYYSKDQKSIKGNYISSGSITDEFINKFQSHILNAVQKYMIDKNNKEIQIHDIEVNSVQFSVGSGFGKHTDAGKGVCFFPDATTRGESNKLPHVRELVVGTMGAVFNKEGTLVLDNEATHCRVTFFDKSTTGKVGSFITKGLFLHLQLHNIQYSCHHEISFLKSNRNPELVRLICSMRMSLPCTYKGPERTGHTNVLSSMTDPNYVIKGLHSKCMATSMLSTNQSCSVTLMKNPCDKYKQIHPSQLQLPRPEGMIITPRTHKSVTIKRKVIKSNGGKKESDSPKFLYDPKMVMTSLEVFNILFNNGISIRFHFSDLKESINHFNNIGTIGTICLTSQVRHHNSIPSNKHHVNISNLDYRKITTIVLEHDYKNSVSEFRRLKDVLVQFEKQKSPKNYSPIADLLNSLDDGDLEVFLGPVGGSFEKAGQYVNIDNNSQIGTTSQPSSYEKHRRFENLITSRSVVELWIPKSWIWEEDKNVHGGSRSIHSVNVGLFYFYKSERRTREYDICCTETKETFVERYGLLGSWTLDTNFTYHLRPVFSKNNPMPSNYLECIETMNLCQDPLEFGVNDTQFSVYCNRSCLKKPTFGTISRFAVAAQHVQDCLEKRGCMNRVNLGTTKYIKERTEKVSKSQFKNELIRIQVASWYRRLRYNVDKDGNVCYVRKEGIGWVHGMYPLPPPFRMYDVITSLVITTMGVKDNSKGGTYFPRRKRNTIDRDKFIGTLMAIIILRTTGRVHLFHQLAVSLGSKRTVELPDTEHKLLFFKRMLVKLSTKDGTMSTFIGVFYKQSLMQRCRGKVKSYITFLDDCRDLVVQMFDKKEYSSWQNSLEPANYYKTKLGCIFTKSGWDTIPDGQNKELFMAHLCIEDLSELYFDENQCDDTYISGYNGLNAALVVDLSSYRQIHSTNSDDSEKMYVKFFYDMINELSKNELVVCGLKRIDDCVVAILNERPVQTLCFVENGSCKLTATEYRTSGAMLVSERPQIHRYYECPQKIDIPNSDIFNSIAQNAIDTFESKQEFRNMDISERYCFPDEKLLWKRFCNSRTPKNLTNNLGIHWNQTRKRCRIHRDT